MMTPEQIATWHQQARDNLFARKSIISPQDALTEFARLVAADTWERAAVLCESEFPRYYGGNMAHFRQCAVALRAEAAKEPKP